MLSFPQRTDYCGSLRPEHDGRTVLLYGWVHRVRDMGGLMFVQLRDVRGLVQVVFDPSADAGLHGRAARLGSEWVVRVRGTVRRRPQAQANQELDTGAVEVVASDLEVLAEADTLPFQVDDRAARAQDALRLKYRYLDLRRPEAARCLVLRSRLTGIIHRYMQEQGFLHFETPELCKSTPEGARDFLVPSRREHGSFYALPQSPQLYKQLLMVAGFDRYYQVARCFRDEDFRADRSVEFTQLDVETSFTSPDGIFAVIEGLLREVAVACPETGFPVIDAIPRMTWAEAMTTYGSDKPDLRFGLPIVDLGPAVLAGGPTGFRAVDEVLATPDGVLRALVVPGAVERFSRKVLDEITEVAKAAGGKGVLSVRWTPEGLASPLVKAMGEDRLRGLLGGIGAAQGDVVLLAAGPGEATASCMGSVRLDVIRREALTPERPYALAWIVEFPWLEKDATTGFWSPRHHPFTKPDTADLARWLDEDPGKIRAQAYDLVLNGYELGGGSVRIHTADLQRKMFDLLRIPTAEAEEKFGFLLDALRFGAPPHAGIALGIDRMTAILAGVPSIRDVIAFPKTGQGKCPLTGAPTPAGDGQLQELGLSVRRPS